MGPYQARPFRERENAAIDAVKATVQRASKLS